MYPKVSKLKRYTRDLNEQSVCEVTTCAGKVFQTEFSGEKNML